MTNNPNPATILRAKPSVKNLDIVQIERLALVLAGHESSSVEEILLDTKMWYAYAFARMNGGGFPPRGNF